MYNSIKKTNKFLLFVLIFQVIVGFTWVSFTASLNVNPALEMILIQFITFGIPTIIYFFITKENPKQVLSIRPISILNILIIIGISIFVQPFMNVLSGITSLFFENNAENIINGTINLPLWVTLLSTALTPAIFEEIVFRGIVFNGYKTTSIVKACFMCGLFFGITHMNIQQFSYTIVMGILFAFLVYKTKSIFASMISHFTINGTQVVMSSLASTIRTNQAVETSLAISTSERIIAILVLLFIALIVSPIFVLLIKAFLKVNKNNTIEDDIIHYNIPKEQQEPIFNIYLIFILVVFFIEVILLPILQNYT